MANELIKTRLRMLRAQKGVNQDAVTEACGLSRVALTRYENGTRVPRIDAVAKLAQYYGVSTDFILGNETPDEEKNDPPSEQEIDGAIVALSKGLTPDELQRVADFVAGLKAARKP